MPLHHLLNLRIESLQIQMKPSVYSSPMSSLYCYPNPERSPYPEFGAYHPRGYLIKVCVCIHRQNLVLLFI